MRRIKIIIVIFFVSIVSWNSINHLVPLPLFSDSGVFASGAFHVLKGKILYKDIWDHKPPMIYFINGLALWLFGFTINSIRLAERIFSVIGVLLFFLILQKIYKNLLLSLAGCLLFIVHFYQQGVISVGNLTEEYAAIFILGGMACSLYACESTKYSHAFSFGSGILFSVAAFTKEPFILSSIPWFFYLIVRASFRNHVEPTPLKFAVIFVCGALTPFSILLVYFLSHGAMKEWIDICSFNLRYSSTYRYANNPNLMSIIVSNAKPLYNSVICLTVTAKIAFAVGLLSLFYKPFLKKNNYLPLVFISMFFMDYTGTLISGRSFGHYYMQIVTPYVFVGISGLAFLADFIDRIKMQKIALLFAAIIFLFVARDYSVWQKKVIQLDMLYKEGKHFPSIVHYIKKHSTESDFIWDTTSDLANYYLETQRCSPTKYFYVYEGLFIDTLKNTAEDKLKALKKDLNKNPPKFIIGSDLSFLKSYGLLDWLRRNYSKTQISNLLCNTEINLYVHN